MADSTFPEGLMNSGLPIDISIRTVSINGVEMPELKTGAVGVTLPDGSVREQEHVALVELRDGTLVNDIRESVRCDLCAVEVEQEAARRGLTPSEIITASRYDPKNIQRSALTGIPLCCRHQVRIALGDGRIVTISPFEEADIRRQMSESSMIERLSLFAGGSVRRAIT